MAWTEFRPTKTGTARKFNKTTGKWETGAWYVYERINGRKVSKPAGSLMSTARKIKREVESEKDDSSVHAERELGAAYNEYEVLIKKTRSPGTWSAYEWGLKKLVKFINNKEKNVKSISKDDIIQFRLKVMEAHSINGLIDILKIVRTFFSYCLECGYIKINPAAKITKGISEVDVAVFLEDAQIRHIIDCLSNPDAVDLKKNNAQTNVEFADIIRTVLLTGMRQGDISSFKVSFIKDNKIFIRKGKGDKPRVIPINSKLAPILAKYMAPGREYVFEGWNVKRIKSRWSRLYRRAKKFMPTLPKKCRFHDLRHTFASNYLRGGGTLADLKLILGHSNLKTTIRYAHFQESDLQDKMEKVKSDFLEALPPEFRVA